MARIPTHFFLAFLLVGGVATLTACEEDVVAVLGVGQPFEVYGVLNPTADTQWVRVFPMVDRLHRLEEPTIDARVTTTDLDTGVTQSWEMSVLSFVDGTHGYLFWSPFRAEGGHSYRIEVVRSDGETSSAAVEVPEVPRIESGYPVIAEDLLLPIRVTEGASHIDSLSVEYRIEYGWCPGSIRTYTFDYLSRADAQGDAARVEIGMSDDFRRIFLDLAMRELLLLDFGVVLIGMKIYTHAGSMWEAPDGEFDPEVLVEPGAMTNVENGFGFVGSGYEYETEMRLYGMTEIFGPPAPHHVSGDVITASGFLVKRPAGSC